MKNNEPLATGGKMERFNGYSLQNVRVNGEIARFRRKRKKTGRIQQKKRTEETHNSPLNKKSAVYLLNVSCQPIT